LYLVEEICVNKIEGITGYFKDRVDVFNAIANYHSSNKKLVEIANSIISILTDKPLIKKQIIVEEVPTKPAFNLNSLITSSVSNVTSTQGVEQKDSKFSFIKKKSDAESKDNSSKDVFNLIPSKTEQPDTNGSSETPNKPKFSFIKSTTNKQIVNGEIHNNPINDLTSKLQEVFSNPDPIFPDIKNGQSHIEIQNSNFIYTHPVRPKYDVPDFDLIFHSANLHAKDPSPIKQEPVQQHKPKVDHFDFVNDLLKKK
jgi:hypothetical protein